MTHIGVDASYLAAGANRQSAAADWSDDGTLCFGAGVNLALWRPAADVPHRGVSHLLGGHKDTVRAVKFLPPDDVSRDVRHLVSGGDDHDLRLWAVNGSDGSAVSLQTIEGAHRAAVNCIAAPQTRSSSKQRWLFASGAADSLIKIWSFDADIGQAVLLQTIQTTPRFFPLCLALVPLDGDGWMLAAAGTSTRVQIFVGTRSPEFVLQATLRGHEGWVRSLDFGWESCSSSSSDILLASASQDKYIRLWRVRKGTELPAPAAATTNSDRLSDFLPGKSPSNKAHMVAVDKVDYSVTFEALLLGHDDWIYSARWDHHSGSSGGLRLLSASADNSLAIWEADPDAGIWITTSRLGELSKEKGATTATGSVGGFWTGLWSPSGQSVATLCGTGSWRRWTFDAAQDRWQQAVAVSGHTAAVTGVAWSRSGAYLLSTSADQTTRLHAEWNGYGGSWHEMARPQIHGYDLNCIDALGASQFVSGADEKLMRVFHEPKTVARLLARAAGPGGPDTAIDAMPDAADMPVLGLSNKAVDGDDEPATAGSVLLDAGHPPFEDVLSRRTLWPETEKLYGHGYEISCLAVSHDGRWIASACRASSLNHAVIRLFETQRWTELRPPLPVHTLTATRLRFSPDDRFLLSVGRDRQWAVFARQAAQEQEASPPYTLQQHNVKAHTRMLLDCAWAPLLPSSRRAVFATAGRDKTVKIWAPPLDNNDTGFALAATIPEQHPVTAIDFLPRLSVDGDGARIVLAIGTETGKLSVVFLATDTLAVSGTLAMEIGYLPKAVLQLAWRPPPPKDESAESAESTETPVHLAIAGEDSSLRVYRFQGL